MMIQCTATLNIIVQYTFIQIVNLMYLLCTESEQFSVFDFEDMYLLFRLVVGIIAYDDVQCLEICIYSASLRSECILHKFTFTMT